MQPGTLYVVQGARSKELYNVRRMPIGKKDVEMLNKWHGWLVSTIDRNPPPAQKNAWEEMQKACLTLMETSHHMRETNAKLSSVRNEIETSTQQLESVTGEMQRLIHNMQRGRKSRSENRPSRMEKSESIEHTMPVAYVQSASHRVH